MIRDSLVKIHDRIMTKYTKAAIDKKSATADMEKTFMDAFAHYSISSEMRTHLQALLKTTRESYEDSRYAANDLKLLHTEKKKFEKGVSATK